MSIPTNDTDRAIDYVEAHQHSNRFLASLYSYYRIHHTLTQRQVEKVHDIIRQSRGR